jgi:antitoxin VapB
MNIYFMKTAKLFKNGQSQAVRLPKEFRFDGDSVYIQRVGNCVMLVPHESPWESMFEATSEFSEDFMETRNQGLTQEREPFDG